MQFNIFGLKTIFFALLIINFSVSANKVSITCSSEIEKGIEVPVISMTVHDATFDDSRTGKDVTHEYAFGGEQSQEFLRIDLNSFNSESAASSSEPFSSSQDQFHNDSQSSSMAFSTWDPLDDIREARCNSIWAEEKYVPESNVKKIDLETNINKAHLLQRNFVDFEIVWPDRLIFEEEFQLWQEELECWKGHGLVGANQRKKSRMVAYEQCKDSFLGFDDYHYKLTNDAKGFLQKNQINSTLFQEGRYNAMQHQLHLELLQIVEELTCFDKNLNYPSAFKLVNTDVANITVIGVQYNKIGNVIKAANIADFCWKVLDCSQAVLNGVVAGVKGAIGHAWENPHEVLLYGVAPELMAGYYTLKLISSIGSLAIDVSRVGVSGSFKAAFKDANLNEVLCTTSSFLTQICLNNWLNNFSVNFVGKSRESLVAVAAGECPVTYSVFKEVCKARANRSYDSIKNIKSRLSKDLKKDIVGHGGKTKVPVLFTDFKQAELDYRGVINKFRKHILHESHNWSRIGLSEDTLIEELVNKVMKITEKLVFCEGDNQIFTRIRNHDVTIRINIFNGKFRSTNLFLGRTDRICDNQINF